MSWWWWRRCWWWWWAGQSNIDRGDRCYWSDVTSHPPCLTFAHSHITALTCRWQLSRRADLTRADVTQASVNLLRPVRRAESHYVQIALLHLYVLQNLHLNLLYTIALIYWSPLEANGYTICNLSIVSLGFIMKKLGLASELMVYICFSICWFNEPIMAIEKWQNFFFPIKPSFPMLSSLPSDCLNEWDRRSKSIIASQKEAKDVPLGSFNQLWKFHDTNKAYLPSHIYTFFTTTNENSSALQSPFPKVIVHWKVLFPNQELFS